MIRILPADQQLPQAAELACQLWPSHSREELHATLQDAISDGGAVLLALEGERPVGFAQCALRRDYVEGSSTSPVGYLEGIFVLPEHRRRGVASALIDEMISRAAALELAFLSLEVRASNSPAIALYRGKGFVDVGVRPGNYEKPAEDAIIMNLYIRKEPQC